MATPASGPASGRTGPAPALPRGLMIVLGFAAATIAVAGMKSISGIIGPAFLALILTVAVHPVRGWLKRKGAPGWVGTLAQLFLVYAIIAGIFVALVVSIARFASIMPQYQAQFQHLIDQGVSWLKQVGVDQKQIKAAVDSLDVGKLAGAATSVLSSLLSILSNLFFIFILLIFLCMDAAVFPTHLEEAHASRHQVVEALASFAHGTRTYLVVSTVFGAIVAVLDAAALWAMGVPAPGLWGLLAFITNYIPNIGFIIGLVPPAVLAILVGGWKLSLAVIVVYCVINLIIQSIIQPRFVGDAVGLSTTLTFLSLVFWAWVLGALGALLAIPLSLLAKALLVDVDPDAAWLKPLLSGSSGDKEKKPRRRRRHADTSTTEQSEPQPEPAGQVSERDAAPAERE